MLIEENILTVLSVFYDWIYHFYSIMLILYHTGVILVYHIQYQRKNLTTLNTGYRYSLSHQVLNGQLSKKKKKKKWNWNLKVRLVTLLKISILTHWANCSRGISENEIIRSCFNLMLRFNVCDHTEKAAMKN